MPPKQVLFVHHDQHSGRLSHEDAIKAWTHVSRRSWQEKPRQLTIKLWQPREDIRDHQAIRQSDEPNTVLVTYDQLQQVYASQKCLKYVEPPQVLGRTEAIFFVAYSYSERSCIAALHHSGDAVLTFEKAEHMLPRMEFSIKSGVDSLISGNITRAFASFEFAAQCLKNALNASILDSVDRIFDTLLPALLYARSRNMHDVVRLFLKQLESLTSIAGGSTHPLAMIAKDLAMVGLTPQLVLKMVRARSDAHIVVEGERKSAEDPLTAPETAVVCQFTEKLSNVAHDFLISCDVLGAGYSIQEAEHDFQQIVEGAVNSLQAEDVRSYLQFLSLDMARVYLANHRYVEAAALLSDVPGQLVEWEEKGWKATVPRTAPLSMMAIIWGLSTLAQMLVAQGKHEEADAMFRLSISAGRKHLEPADPGNPAVIQVQQTYLNYLIRQNRPAEAAEVDRMMDLGLEMYMLNVDDE